MGPLMLEFLRKRENLGHLGLDPLAKASTLSQRAGSAQRISQPRPVRGPVEKIHFFLGHSYGLNGIGMRG